MKHLTVTIILFVGLIIAAAYYPTSVQSHDAKTLAFAPTTNNNPTASTRVILEVKGETEKTRILKFAKVCAAKYNLPEGIIRGICFVESSVNANARSYVNALGVCQVMPSTARFMAEKHNFYKKSRINLYNPYVNVDIACIYLAYLLKHFDNNMNKALSYYNCGNPYNAPGYVAKVRKSAQRTKYMLASSGDITSP